jgi:hypothetical protein
VQKQKHTREVWGVGRLRRGSDWSELAHGAQEYGQSKALLEMYYRHDCTLIIF